MTVNPEASMDWLRVIIPSRDHTPRSTTTMIRFDFKLEPVTATILEVGFDDVVGPWTIIWHRSYVVYHGATKRMFRRWFDLTERFISKAPFHVLQ
jgi:hypothetical protein